MAQNDKSSNTMGDITNNQGIVTQGQVGNNTIYNLPARRADSLYQADQIVGRVDGAKMGPGANQITVKNLRIASGTVDLSAPLEFQDFLIRCAELSSQPRAAAMTAIMFNGYAICEIVGKRK